MPLAVNGFKVCSSPNCPYQGQPQPVENFSNHKRYGDGKQPQCKTCLNTLNAKYRKTEARKISQTKYNRTEKAKATNERYSQSEKARETRTKRYREQHPKKDRPKKERTQPLFKVCPHPDCIHKGQEQPSTNFCKSNRTPDGLQGRCKDCDKRYRERYSGSESDRVSKARYSNSEKGIAKRKEYRQSEQAKTFYRSRNQKYRQDPVMRVKILARNKLNKAVRAGQIPHVTTLICKRCGKPARQYHHYLGYEPEHWFDVEPYCTKCHHLIG